MTDHTGDRGANASPEGDHDPVVADRFRLLDRVPTPDVTSPTTGLAGPNGADPSGRRSGFLLAVAACVGVLMVGIVALVAANAGDGNDVAEEVGEIGDVPVVADEASDTAAPLVVEGDSGAADRGATPDTDGDTGSDNTPGGAAESDAEETDPPSTSGTPDDDAPAVDDDRPVTTASTATTTAAPPTTAGPDDTAGETIALQGTVTEVFTDCVSRLLLTDTGQVVQGGPVTCDGGSYIVVDGTRVFTSSGFTSADLAFDKHPSNLKPGQEVSVIAVRTGGSSGPLTLACDSCRLRIVG